MGGVPFSHDFPPMRALLQTEAGRIVETGFFSVSEEDRTVDFTGDFVPLYRMGSRLKVVCLFGDLQVHSFTGEVYLSSPELMRLVSIEDEVLPGAWYAFQYEVELEADVRVISLAATVPSRKLFRRPLLRHGTDFSCIVHSISMSIVHFTADQPLEKGQQLAMHVRHPAIGPIPLVVTQVLDFQQARNNYRCDVQSDISPSPRGALETMVAQLSLQNKLF